MRRSKLFDLYELEVDIERRYSDLVHDLLTVLSPIQHDIVFIIDPYYDVNANVGLLLNTRSEEKNGFWFWLLYELIMQGVSWISVITCESFRGFIETEHRRIGAKFPCSGSKCRFIISQESTQIEFCYYTKPNAVSLDPNHPEVHDRWFLMNSSRRSIGFHLGASLDSIHNKDLTVTRFRDSEIARVIKRFSYLKSRCSERSKW